MKWTTEVPSLWGWYWYRCPPHTLMCVCLTGGGEWLTVKHPYNIEEGEWLGPIHPDESQ